MATVAFDTHQAMKQLLAAGFADDQAEAVVAMMGQAANGRWATKDDLAGLTTKTDFAELKGDFSELKGEFFELKGGFFELGSNVEALRSEVEAMRSSLNNMRWMIVLLVTLFGIMAALFFTVAIRLLFF